MKLDTLDEDRYHDDGSSGESTASSTTVCSNNRMSAFWLAGPACTYLYCCQSQSLTPLNFLFERVRAVQASKDESGTAAVPLCSVL